MDKSSLSTTSRISKAAVTSNKQISQFALVLLVTLAAAGTVQAAQNAAATLPNTFAPVVERIAPSVVTVYSKRTVKEDLVRAPFDNPLFRRFFGIPDDEMLPNTPPPEREMRGLGSGVIVSSDGFILSNSHVVEGADEVKVALPNDPGEHIAKVIGTDPHTEIAVLKIEASNLPASQLADSDQLKVGDVVLAVGNPFGVGQTVTLGIVSGLGRAGMGITDYEDFIQTDASINPGNSGGALVNAQGEVIGINTAILSRTGGNVGIGFAVPINLARGVMDQIIKTGRVRRGYLGVYIQPITESLAAELNLPTRRGALVGGLMPNSPGAEAGLEVGDAITEFNGRQVTDARQLRLMVSQAAPNSTAILKLIRDGQERELKVRLGELPTPGEEEGMLSSQRSDSEGQGKDALEGVQVSNLTDSIRQQLQIPAHVTGALITAVAPGSAAAEAGLRPGDVILEIERQEVRNAQEAVRLSRTADNSVLLRVWSEGGSRLLVLKNS